MTLPPFSAVLDEHRAALWRHLVAVAGPTDAPDLLQETLIAALRAYPTLADGRNLRGWLFTIAHNKVVDAARARSRRAVPVHPVPEPPPSPGPSAADEAGLWAAVRLLPPKQRASVVHRFVDDLPYAEIGRIVGCSEAAARQNVRAALMSLRGDLDAHPAV